MLRHGDEACGLWKRHRRDSPWCQLRYKETLRFASGVLSGVAKLAGFVGTAGCILLHQHQREKPNDLKASLPLSAKLFGQLWFSAGSTEMPRCSWALPTTYHKFIIIYIHLYTYHELMSGAKNWCLVRNKTSIWIHLRSQPRSVAGWLDWWARTPNWRGQSSPPVNSTETRRNSWCGCVWKCCVPLNPMVNDHYPYYIPIKWL